MNYVLRAASYVFHPVWMPFAGTFIYFLVTPRFFPEALIKGKLLAVAIMTLFIPIVFYFLLKTLGMVQSHFMRDVRERKWPLLFYTALILVTLKFVLNVYDYPELYYFFIGILISSLVALIMAWLRVKISLHLMGLAGLLMFIMALSISYDLNLVYTVSFFVAVTGLTASSRLHYRAHSLLELTLGFLIGLLPQISLLPRWV